jgi:mannitol-1-/sugar-/sorbitol-6-phosphatase
VSFDVQVVLFDLDGVLVDSEAAVRSAWHHWATEHGLDPDRTHLLAQGRRTIDTVRELAPALDAAAESTILEGLELAEAGTTFPQPGAADALAALTPDRWAVVTSGTRALAAARLSAAGLPRPRVFLTADDISEGKPHPEGYLTAAAAMGADPAVCLVVEDAPAGIASGRAAGARVLAVATTHRPDELGAADAVIGDLTSVRFAFGGGRLLVSTLPAVRH